MKYLIALSLLCWVGIANAALLPDYPATGRFIEYNINGTGAYLLVDTRTGCEYIRASTGTGTAYTFVQGSCNPQEPKK